MEFLNFINHRNMKKLKIVIIFCLMINSLEAQEKQDSTIIAIDTLNLSGIVVDENGKPLAGIKVSTTFAPKHTFTDSTGAFHFTSVNATDRIFITSENLTIFENIAGNRFIKLIFKPLEDYNINMQGYTFREHNVNANRITKKPTMKVKVSKEVYSFDSFGHFNPPLFAGGMEKFYKYMTENIIFPADAIKNNAEGLVKISFVVKKYGGFKDIEIIRDIGFGCADEVIRILKTTEKRWSPASNMMFIEQRVVFQIPFKLIDE